MKQFLCFLFTLVLWLLLTWPTSLSQNWPDIVAGVFFALLVSTLLAQIYPDNPQKAGTFRLGNNTRKHSIHCTGRG